VTFTVNKETETGFMAEYVDGAIGKTIEIRVWQCEDDDDPCISRVASCEDTDSEDDLMSDDDSDSDDVIDDDDLYLLHDGPGEDMDSMADIMAKVEGYAMSKFGCHLPGLRVEMRTKLDVEPVDDGFKSPTGPKNPGPDAKGQKEEGDMDFK